MSETLAVREGIFREITGGWVLIGSKCKSCGRVFFPKAQFCFDCFDQEMDEVPLSRRGSLYSYTVSHMPSTHFDPPYAVGYVDLPEGVRVFTPLRMENDKRFLVGMEMEVVIEPLWKDEDKEIIGYRFAPVPSTMEQTQEGVIS